LIISEYLIQHKYKLQYPTFPTSTQNIYLRLP
jgi:hypothetical protein